MRIAVIGAGAMGGMFGARLARAGADVALLDSDAAHIAAIVTDGLAVEQDGHQHWSRLPATTDPSLIDLVDLALVLVDCNATAEAARIAAGLIGELVPPSRCRTASAMSRPCRDPGAGRVLAGSTMNSAARLAPGRIAHTIWAGR